MGVAVERRAGWDGAEIGASGGGTWDLPKNSDNGEDERNRWAQQESVTEKVCELNGCRANLWRLPILLILIENFQTSDLRPLHAPCIGHDIDFWRCFWEQCHQRRQSALETPFTGSMLARSTEARMPSPLLELQLLVQFARPANARTSESRALC